MFLQPVSIVSISIWSHMSNASLNNTIRGLNNVSDNRLIWKTVNDKISKIFRGSIILIYSSGHVQTVRCPSNSASQVEAQQILMSLMKESEVLLEFWLQITWSSLSPSYFICPWIDVSSHFQTITIHTNARSQHRELRPLLFANSAWVLLRPTELSWTKVVRRDYRPYLKRIEILTICRCHYKGNTFSSVTLRPWVVVRPEFGPATSRTVARCSSNWDNRSTVKLIRRMHLTSKSHSPDYQDLRGIQ